MTIRFNGLVLVSFALVASALRAQERRPPTANVSALSKAQRTAIGLAIKKWDRQFKWMARDNSGKSLEGASFEAIHLGPPSEEDMIVTNQSECSPTGNCSILILRPVSDGYRVVLDGIGQTYTIRRTRTKDYRDIQLTMHGSATESTVKTYKFNGLRYLRSGCENLTFAIDDEQGNLQELDKPRVSPCK